MGQTQSTESRAPHLVLIGLITRNPYALVVNPAFPASNAREFVALLKANPDKYTFSSSGQ